MSNRTPEAIARDKAIFEASQQGVDHDLLAEQYKVSRTTINAIVRRQKIEQGIPYHHHRTAIRRSL